MRLVKVNELAVEKFWPYGFYANMLNPDTERIGAAPIEFFRDMLQLNLGNSGVASFSTCRVERREFVIDVSEYHNATGEGILPLDNDILIHVAPATPADNRIPLEKIEVFRVPKGTMVALRPGVWHHAPFTVNDQPANVLIVLPERTYATDCKVFEIKGRDKISIDL